MYNYIIDNSLFSIPPKSSNLDIEKEYFCTLVKNMKSFYYLKKNDYITLSFYGKFDIFYQNNKYFICSESEINERIKNLLSEKQECFNDIGLDDPFLEDWDYFMDKLKSKINKNGKVRKGKIGIFNNIPDRDNEPSDDYIKYSSLKNENDIYPDLPQSFFDEFKKYSSYTVYLNQKYDCSNINYILLGNSHGNKELNKISLSVYNNEINIKSDINVIGICNAIRICPVNISFKTLPDACKKAIGIGVKGNKGDFSDILLIGSDVSEKSITNMLSRFAGPPGRIYYYLETLSIINNVIKKNGIKIQNDNNLVEILNAYGLLCSPDDYKNYLDYKCKHRRFNDKNGKNPLFSVHLKPSTYSQKYFVEDEEDDEGEYYTKASEYTVRIYIKWDESKKKIIVGWIGKHPPSCRGDCIYTDCKGYKK